ncbi:MAG: ATP-binding protein [Acidobacteria bacterium]|nr:ATP-binding protein [Acidobacteriota bacterium]
MLTRLYVDNFRCLVNFEFRPGAKQLMLGSNGSGKSSVFDVLGCLRLFALGGVPAQQVFLPAFKTRWQSLSQQTFELDTRLAGQNYRYQLIVEVHDPPAIPRVLAETLQHEGKPIFEFLQGEVRLFDDQYQHKVSYPFDWFRSALATILPRADNAKITRFKSWLGRLIWVRIDPRAMMMGLTENEDQFLRVDFGNFANWYRHLSQENTQAIGVLRDSLRDVLDGFESMDLRSVGPRARLLKVLLKSPAGNGKLDEYEFHELSDGQRTLIGLYTLLHCALDRDTTVCIDEPDNFVALEEIQPWLMELLDRADDVGGQVLLISHHPELLNYMAPSYGVVFRREGAGPVRMEPFRPVAEKLLSPAEQVARGWDRG